MRLAVFMLRCGHGPKISARALSRELEGEGGLMCVLAILQLSLLLQTPAAEVATSDEIAGAGNYSSTWVEPKDYVPSQSTRDVLQRIEAQVFEEAQAADQSPRVAESRRRELLRQQLLADRICELLRGWQLRGTSQSQKVNELQGLGRELPDLSRSIESCYQVQSQICTAAWPLLLSESEPAIGHVVVLASKPSFGVQMNEQLAWFGFPTEPLQWDVQAARSVALARLGKFNDARQENSAMLKKIATNVKKLRHSRQQIRVRNSQRTLASLQQEVLLQQAFILVLAGEHAAADIVQRRANAVNVAIPTTDDLAEVAQLQSALLLASKGPRPEEPTRTGQK